MFITSIQKYFHDYLDICRDFPYIVATLVFLIVGGTAALIWLWYPDIKELTSKKSKTLPETEPMVSAGSNMETACSLSEES